MAQRIALVLRYSEATRKSMPQIIDDVNGKTLATAASLKLGFEGNKTDVAKQVGMKLAEVAKGKGIETVSFDRGGFLYHGRVKALAEGAREGGLKF